MHAATIGNTGHAMIRWIGFDPREEGWLALLARLGIGFSPELLDLGDQCSRAGLEAEGIGKHPLS